MKEMQKRHQRGFTLIEVIISVMVISVVIVAALEISSRSADSAVYLSKRNKIAFQDSLFLDEHISQYHKDSKNAYDLLQPLFKVTEQKSIEALKSINREIIIPEPLITSRIEPPAGDTAIAYTPPEATIEQAVLKDQYASRYFRFKLPM